MKYWSSTSKILNIIPPTRHNIQALCFFLNMMFRRAEAPPSLHSFILNISAPRPLVTIIIIIINIIIIVVIFLYLEHLGSPLPGNYYFIFISIFFS